MDREILYYPFIRIEKGQWLYKSLMYWDKISSIVPGSWEFSENNQFSKEIQELQGEGIYNPLRPYKLIQERYKEKEDLEKEYIQLVKDEDFAKYISGERFKLYKNKTSDLIEDFLIENGLAENDPANPYEILLVEKNAGLLYMGLLAKYIALVDNDNVTPSTDYSEYQNLIFSTEDIKKGYDCVNINFQNLLPEPDVNVPIKKIIKYRIKRRDNLLHFRTLIDDFQSEIMDSESIEDMKQILNSSKENIEKGVSDLKETLNDMRIASSIGSMKTLIDIKSPTLWGTAGVALGKATAIATLPLGYTVGGLALMGSIQIGNYLVNQHNKKKTVLRESPFSYLYLAEKKGLIK